MYLYHYPDIWYDYATWHAKSGSVDSAIKVFHRALKALPGIYQFDSYTGFSFDACVFILNCSLLLQEDDQCQDIGLTSDLYYMIINVILCAR